jgi:hypothetical protein
LRSKNPLASRSAYGLDDAFNLLSHNRMLGHPEG